MKNPNLNENIFLRQCKKGLRKINNKSICSPEIALNIYIVIYDKS